MSIPVSAPLLASTAPSGSSTASANKINPLLETGKGKGEDHFSFWDFLDIINPLQHIPIVNNVYRAVTGDQINNFSRIAGGALYGGMIGAAFGMANAVAVNETGDDIGGVAMSKMGLIKSQEETQEDAKNDKAGKIDPMANASAASPDLKNIPMVEIHPSDKHADAAKDDIIWDKPIQVAEAQPSAMPVAMPSPKELNDISPGEGTADPSVSKADVQKNMLAALNKYNAMQSIDAPNAIIAAPAAATATSAPKNIFATPAGAPSTDIASNTPTLKKPTPAFNKLRHF